MIIMQPLPVNMTYSPFRIGPHKDEPESHMHKTFSIACYFLPFSHICYISTQSTHITLRVRYILVFFPSQPLL